LFATGCIHSGEIKIFKNKETCGLFRDIPEIAIALPSTVNARMGLMIKLYTSTEVPVWKRNAYSMHFENFQKSRVLNIPTNFKCIGLSINEYF